MTKTFCDRCGKEITKAKYAWINHKEVYAKLHIASYTSEENFREQDKHICPECDDSFIHWFMYPEGDKRL